MKKQNTRLLVLMWCYNQGTPILETMIDITSLPDELETLAFQKLQNIPKENEVSLTQLKLNHMKLRAMYNIARNYQIMGVKVPSALTDEMIQDNFERFAPIFEKTGFDITT